ncbi:hypothetical protein OH492_20695 [Vibrio chagasii]|nr:hypothetical protein [Vibrio chagasii]
MVGEDNANDARLKSSLVLVSTTRFVIEKGIEIGQKIVVQGIVNMRDGVPEFKGSRSRPPC